MWLKFLLIASLTIVSTLSEAPLAGQSKPYPAAGWRPDTPFNLPGEEEEYLPPRREFFEPQKQVPQLQPANVEISKERVDFAGQIQGNSFLATNQPQNAYSPPTNANEEPDFLKVQGLPNRNKPQFFKKQQSRPQRKKQPFFRPQPSPPQQQQQQFGQGLPTKEQPQNFQPLSPPQPQQFVPDNQQLPIAQPAQQYGAPSNYNEGKFNIVYPDLEPEPRSLQPQAQQQSDDGRLTIEALKIAVDAYNRNAADESQTPGAAVPADYDDTNSGANTAPELARLTQGQYYILGPDNTLQRVKFTTSQNMEESRNKEFTAQLKYTSVGEISDPVFKYNNRGQLVRIFKK